MPTPTVCVCNIWQRLRWRDAAAGEFIQHCGWSVVLCSAVWRGGEFKFIQHCGWSDLICCVLYIIQVLIDDCGMCKEVESLLPIIKCQPQQVILLGDHCQLGPVVLNDSVSSLGLGRSLFERYAAHARWLTTHYHMVPLSVCLSLCLSVCLSVCVSVSVCLSSSSSPVFSSL